MKASLTRIFSIALIFGIVTFPFLGSLSHYFSHSLDLNHGSHVADVSHHSDEKSHPDVDLKSSDDGIIQRSLSRYFASTIVLMKFGEESFSNSINTNYQKIDPLPPQGPNPYLQPYFSHAPPVLF